MENQQRGKYCAGQWKDVESFNNALNSLAADFQCVEFQCQRLDKVVSLCKQARADDIIVYYSFLPELLADLRRELPDSRLYVRTVNAEALQHWQRSEIDMTPTYRNLRSVYGAVRLFWRDSRCKRVADALLGISEWDNRVYWRRLPGKADVFDVPYSCPWPRLRSMVEALPWKDKKKQVVCLAGGRDPIGRSMIRGLESLAEAFGNYDELRDWEFFLSPGIFRSKNEDLRSGRVQRLERLGEPWDLLCSVRAAAVLTPLGFGFKTTILDALTAGCHVLVDKRLAKRLPAAIRIHCIEVSTDKKPDMSDVRRRLDHAPAGTQVNDILRQQAVLELSRAFKL